jgi:hypothetical protein
MSSSPCRADEKDNQQSHNLQPSPQKTPTGVHRENKKTRSNPTVQSTLPVSPIESFANNLPPTLSRITQLHHQYDDGADELDFEHAFLPSSFHLASTDIGNFELGDDISILALRDLFRNCWRIGWSYSR